MKAYLDILQKVLDNGTHHEDRTGVRTKRIFGATFEHDMRTGFPLLTTKEINYTSAFAEMLGFIRGYSSAYQFRSLGTNVWNINANETQSWVKNPNRLGPDDLGRIYGVQWRGWRGPDRYRTDQLAKAIKVVIDDPDTRKNVVAAWNPAELHLMALEPCHTEFQLVADKVTKLLSIRVTIRSSDAFLGLPFNIAGYALLLSIIAKVTGYIPHTLLIQGTDVHIYSNHMEQVNRQLGRVPHIALPTLTLPEFDPETEHPMEYMETIEPYHCKISGYVSASSIGAPMAA